MISDKLGQSLKEEFLSICKKDICRDGIEELLGWVEESDFFYAPASTKIYAIRFHMGGFDSAVKGGDGSISKAYELCPLAVLLHLADMTASYLMEDRNA